MAHSTSTAFPARHLRKGIVSNAAFRFAGNGDLHYCQFTVRGWLKLRVSVVDLQEFDGLTLPILRMYNTLAVHESYGSTPSTHASYKFSSSNPTSM